MPTKILIDKNFPTKVSLLPKTIIKAAPIVESNAAGISFK